MCFFLWIHRNCLGGCISQICLRKYFLILDWCVWSLWFTHRYLIWSSVSEQELQERCGQTHKPRDFFLFGFPQAKVILNPRADFKGLISLFVIMNVLRWYFYETGVTVRSETCFLRSSSLTVCFDRRAVNITHFFSLLRHFQTPHGSFSLLINMHSYISQHWYKLTFFISATGYTSKTVRLNMSWSHVITQLCQILHVFPSHISNQFDKQISNCITIFLHFKWVHISYKLWFRTS